VGVDDHRGGNMSHVHQLDLVLVLALVVGEGASLDSAVADGLIVQETLVVLQLEHDVFFMRVLHVQVHVTVVAPLDIVALFVARLPMFAIELNQEEGLNVVYDSFTLDVSANRAQLQVTFVHHLEMPRRRIQVLVWICC